MSSPILSSVRVHARQFITAQPVQAWIGTTALLLALALLAAVPMAGQSATADASGAAIVSPPSAKPLPLQFVPNVGQWQQPELLYLTRAADLDALFKRDHIELRLRDADAPAALRLRPLNAKVNALQPGAARVTVVNDYRGQDPARWHSGIPTYEDLRYTGLYPDIDLLFRTQERQLAYDFIVHPGADPAQIRIALDGAQELSIEPDGSLRARLPDGREFRQQPPVIYQERNGEREPVNGRFQVLASNSAEDAAPVYGFAIGDYDPSRVLVIDPTLEYANFVGGSGDETIRAMHVTSDGAVMIAGTTASADFAEAFEPTTVVREIGDDDDGNPVFASLGRENGFIYKMNAAGTNLDFVTLLGGGGNDAIRDFAVASDGNIYVVGSTNSDDFPLVNPLFRPFLTGRTDAFITKLDSEGELVTEDDQGFSTYYGANGQTAANAVALDKNNNIYIAGVTSAPDLRLYNPLYPTLAGRGDDGFIVQLGPNGTSLEYATYFGGARNDSIDYLEVSENGDLFFAGHTSSSVSDNFPLNNAIQPTLGGRQDAFLARIARGGQALVFSTYIGGSNQDVLTGFAMDNDGNYLMSGYTTSDDWPQANQQLKKLIDYPEGSRNEMGTLAKVDKTGHFLHFATYIGAFDNDTRALAVAPGKEMIYVAGTTESNLFPMKNAYQDYYIDNGDGFLAMLSLDGQLINFSTYFGGSAADEIVAVRQASAGSDTSVIFAGHTQEERNAPLFPGDSQTGDHAGRTDTFVARFDDIKNEDIHRKPYLKLDTNLNPIYPGMAIDELADLKKYIDGESDPPFANFQLSEDRNIYIPFTIKFEDRDVSGSKIIALSAKILYDPEQLEAVLTKPDEDWYRDYMDQIDGKWFGQDLSSAPEGDFLGFFRYIRFNRPGELEVNIFQPGTSGPIDAETDAGNLVAFNLKLRELSSTQHIVVEIGDVSAVIQGDLDASISEVFPGTRFVESRCNDLIGDCDCSCRVQLFEVQSAATDFLNHTDSSSSKPDVNIPICRKRDYFKMQGMDLANTVHNYLTGRGCTESGEESMSMGVLAASSSQQEAGVDALPSGRLDFGLPQVSGNRVSFDLNLRASEQPEVVSANFYYDPEQIDQLSGVIGAAASSAGKRAEINVVEPGWLRVVIWGINQTTIPDGVVARLNLDLASGRTIDDVSLDMEASAAIPSLERDINLGSNNVNRGHLTIRMVSGDGARH